MNYGDWNEKQTNGMNRMHDAWNENHPIGWMKRKTTNIIDWWMKWKSI